MNKVIKLVPADFRRVVFCDGSAFAAEDGHDPLIKIAAWNSFDCSFCIQEFREDSFALLKKQQMAMLAEKLALDLAVTFSPELIYSDAKNLVKQSKGEYKGIGLAWCARAYNGIADALTRRPAGRGYIVFNASQPRRKWIDFVYS